MKKINSAVLLFVLLASCNLYSQNKSGTNFSPGGYDSLLFDGGRNNSYMDGSPCGVCKIRFWPGTHPVVYGTWCEKRTDETCGEIDTFYVRRKGIIPLTVNEILDGDTIRTEDSKKNEVVLQIDDGKTITMGKYTSFYISENHCNQAVDVVLHYGLIYLDFSKNGDRSKSIGIRTERGEVITRGTRYTVEIAKEGDVLVDIVKVYEGSVTFRPNMDNETNKKEVEKYGNDASDKAALLQKLTEDYQSGKITLKEYSDQLKVVMAAQQTESIMKNVTLEAGYVSRINGSGNPSDPVTFDVSDDPGK